MADEVTHESEQSVPSLSTQLEQLKSSYPAYYRAWKSMITSYGVDSVIPEWRGTAGLAQFITDTSTIIDSPTFLPTIQVRLKRKLAAFQFSPANAYWKIPAASTRKVAALKRASQTTKLIVPEVGVVQYPARRDEDVPSSIEALKKLYPTPQDVEDRMNTLFDIQFNGGGLSELQTIELDVLGTISKGEPIEPLDKFTDV